MVWEFQDWEMQKLVLWCEENKELASMLGFKITE